MRSLVVLAMCGALAQAATLELLHTERLPGLPTLTGGMVGMLSYDAVRRMERIPDLRPDELHVPELDVLLDAPVADEVIIKR